MEIGTVRRNPASGFYEFYTGIPDDKWSSAFYPKSDAEKYAKEYVKLLASQQVNPPKKNIEHSSASEKILDFFSQPQQGI